MKLYSLSYKLLLISLLVANTIGLIATKGDNLSATSNNNFGATQVSNNTQLTSNIAGTTASTIKPSSYHSNIDDTPLNDQGQPLANKFHGYTNYTTSHLVYGRDDDGETDEDLLYQWDNDKITLLDNNNDKLGFVAQYNFSAFLNGIMEPTSQQSPSYFIKGVAVAHLSLNSRNTIAKNFLVVQVSHLASANIDPANDSPHFRSWIGSSVLFVAQLEHDGTLTGFQTTQTQLDRHIDIANYLKTTPGTNPQDILLAHHASIIIGGNSDMLENNDFNEQSMTSYENYWQTHAFRPNLALSTQDGMYDNLGSSVGGITTDKDGNLFIGSFCQVPSNGDLENKIILTRVDWFNSQGQTTQTTPLVHETVINNFMHQNFRFLCRDNIFERPNESQNGNYERDYMFSFNLSTRLINNKEEFLLGLRGDQNSNEDQPTIAQINAPNHYYTMTYDLNDLRIFDNYQTYTWNEVQFGTEELAGIGYFSAFNNIYNTRIPDTDQMIFYGQPLRSSNPNSEQNITKIYFVKFLAEYPNQTPHFELEHEIDLSSLEGINKLPIFPIFNGGYSYEDGLYGQLSLLFDPIDNTKSAQITNLTFSYDKNDVKRTFKSDLTTPIDASSSNSKTFLNQLGIAFGTFFGSDDKLFQMSVTPKDTSVGVDQSAYPLNNLYDNTFYQYNDFSTYSDKNSNTNKVLVIALSVSLGVLVIIIIAGVFWFRHKHNQNMINYSQKIKKNK